MQPEKSSNAGRRGQGLKEEDVRLIRELIQNKNNILIAGERSSGKTAFLSFLFTLIPEEENVLLFDFFSEVNIPKRTGKSIRVGYKEDAMIKGAFGKVAMKEMIDKSLLLPFDRILADELYGEGTDVVLDSLHLGRSGYFSIPEATAENALKFLFLKTIYPENKVLEKKDIQRIKNVFKYVVTINKDVVIEKINFSDDGIHFEILN